MLSTNVLCLKKKKKRSYCIVNKAENGAGSNEKNKRSAVGTATMLQITEDTPPDMLAGAMDLTVHLPTGRSVKMSVERSTPMMDLLVQITTNYQLQLSNHTLQVLGMAPSNTHSDSVLPYKPNTPIGALDTQHIKVVPKPRTMVVPKNVPPGHQPFESTFRLKVHLPRNQLYVTRVSQSVHLEDIKKKVCEEKNLDPGKYEFRHPGNLDEILDPKLTLNDYTITEIYLVQKGIGSLNQTFSTNDIMALRKEEERKQMHSKTGGGVFNLIFRRGKSSTGSLSSENRSISPTHSDDSRSVTPPAVQQIIAPPPDQTDRPKPPQRKRRPAPKPPVEAAKKDAGLTVCHSRNSSDSSGYHEASILSDNNASLPRRPKSTVIGEESQKLISGHSQSTSNLSKMGVHSKSTSSLAFPSRKKKTAPPPPPPVLKPEKTHNLEEPSPVVASQPCTVAQAEAHGIGHGSIVVNHTNPKPKPRNRTKTAPSPRPRSLVSVSSEEKGEVDKLPENKEESVEAWNTRVKVELSPNNETTLTRIHGDFNQRLAENKTEEAIPVKEEIKKESVGTEVKVIEIADSAKHYPEVIDDGGNLAGKLPDVEKNDKTKKEDYSEIFEDTRDKTDEKLPEIKTKSKKEENSEIVQEIDFEDDWKELDEQLPEGEKLTTKTKDEKNSEIVADIREEIDEELPESKTIDTKIKNEDESEIVEDNDKKIPVVEKPNDKQFDDSLKEKFSELAKLQKIAVTDILEPKTDNPKVKPPEVVAVHPKTPKKDNYPKSFFDSYTRKRGFQIGSSLLDLQSEDDTHSTKNSDLSTPTSVASALNAFEFVDEIEDVDVEMFTGSLSKNSTNKNKILNQLHGMHELDNFKKNHSGGSLRSVSSLPGFLGGNMKKWENIEELDDISLGSLGGRSGWVIGDTSDTESVASTTTPQGTPFESLTSTQQSLPPSSEKKEKEVEEVTIPPDAPPPPIPTENPSELEPTLETKNPADPEPPRNNELDADWQYQLPSPPKAFRDSSPVAFADVGQESIGDSVVTSPELFEKLKLVKDQSEKETASDVTSMVSEEERPILNKLSLENLEKRKSLVYNRELATSLKMPEDNRKETFSSSLVNFEKTYEEVKQSSLKQTSTSTLPNFKITTYNNPKQKVDIFEDDTVRSNDRSSKRNSSTEPSLQKSFVGRSMENISFRKNSVGRSSEEEFSQTEYTFYRPQAPKPQFNVFRSESFTKEQKWVPVKPVSRSKSQVAINKYRDPKSSPEVDDGLTKSNSLFDVSGLQSLGVMRQIQNKLNTPNNSTEELDKEEPSYQKPPESKNEVQTPEERPIIRCYKYSPPSINMGTWSERPKIPVNVKEDPDYKYGIKDTNTSKLVVNTINNDIKSHNSIEIRNKTTFTNSVSVRVTPDTNKNVSIKVNGFEPATHSGNVVIKIGGNQQNKPIFRKPLGNVNKETQRPHSIAFGSDFDISRVPIVRSVELKKPYREYHSTTNNNTSYTQINPSTNFRNGLKEQSQRAAKPQTEPKPVFRVNSYLQNSSAPVVRGFRSNDVNRTSWNQPHSFSTLPAKPVKNYALDTPKPFSQANLRRTESTNVEKKVPPAPVMPKFSGNAKREDFGDPKEQLLQAIRDFGGKKGLRAVKA